MVLLTGIVKGQKAICYLIFRHQEIHGFAYCVHYSLFSAYNLKWNMFSVLLITADPPEPVVLNIMLSSVLLSVVCVFVCVSCGGFCFRF